MRKTIIAIATLLFLASCDSYQRNYSGPLLSRDKVAYLFNDTQFYGSLYEENKEKDTANSTTIPEKDYQLFSKDPICREILPGSYSIEAWKDEQRPFGGGKGGHIIRKKGPYITQFEVEAGRMYCVREVRIPRKSQFLFFPITEYLLEVNIVDVSENPKYRELANTAKRQ